MAKNLLGFIQRKYRQPNYYRECFGQARAFYHAENGNVFFIGGCTNSYGSRFGEDIKYYEVCVQLDTCVQILRTLPSQKQAMEALEKLLEENKKPNEEVLVFTAEQTYDGCCYDTIVKVFATEEMAKAYMQYFIHEADGEECIANNVKEDDWVIDVDEPTLYRACAKMDYPNNHVECRITECEINK